MKRLFLMAALAMTAEATLADTYVDGYMRKDGTYVPGHYRSTPNSTRSDNIGRPNSGYSSSYGLAQPSYQRDSDRDGISNRYDFDDNNNGVNDDFERRR